MDGDGGDAGGFQEEEMTMQLRFWGVRGSIPVAGPDTLRTGGNTSCLELTCEGERLVIDGGTGLRALGEHLGFRAMKLSILFTHTHWDHIQGIPFFSAAYHPGSQLTFMGPTRQTGTLGEVLASQMRPPTFPIQMKDLPASVGFAPIDEGQSYEIGPFRVSSIDLSHPDGVRAYRVEAGGKVFVHATDVEHGEQLDLRLVRFAEGADLLVHDAQYTKNEYLGVGGPSRRGWGHATWTDAVSVGRQAGVGRVALFHHDPNRTDAGVEAIEAEARAELPGTFAAREGAPIAL